MAKKNKRKRNKESRGRAMISQNIGGARSYHANLATPVPTVDSLEPLVPDSWGLFYVPGASTTLGKTSFFLGVNRVPAQLDEANIITVAKIAEHKDAKEAAIMALMPDNPKVVPEFTDSVEDEIKFAYQGIIRKTVYDTGGNTIVLKAKSDVALGVSSEPEGIEFTVKQKIPHELLKAAIAYAKHIYELHRTEFAWQIYRSKEDGTYMLYIPGQIIQSAHVNYQEDVNARQNIRNNGHTLVLEGHSHGAMGAFFSGGDDANEKQPCAYIVLAGFNTDKCSAVARVRVGTYDAPLAIDDLFDLPEGRDVAWLLDSTDIPAVCPTIVASAAKPAAATTTAYSYNYGTGYNGYRDRTHNVVDFPNYEGRGRAARLDRRQNAYGGFYDDGFSDGLTSADYDDMTDAEWLRLYGYNEVGPAEPKGLHADTPKDYKNNCGITATTSIIKNLLHLAGMPASEYNDEASSATDTMEYREVNNIRMALGQAKQLELIGALAKRASVTMKAFLDGDGTSEGDIVNAEDLAASLSERESIKVLRWLLNNIDSSFYSRK